MAADWLKAGTLVKATMGAVEQTNKEMAQQMDRGMSAYQEASSSDGYKIARQLNYLALKLD